MARVVEFRLNINGFSQRSLRRDIFIVAQFLITLLLLFVLIFLFDWNRIGMHVLAAKVGPLIGALLCLMAIVVVGALNIWVLLNGLTQISFMTTLRFYLVSWCTFLLLPGSAGDAVQIVFLKEAGVPYRDGGAVYLTDKLVTLTITMLLALIGGLINFRAYLRPWIVLGVTALIVLVMIAAYTSAQGSRNVWVLELMSLIAAPVFFCKNHAGRVGMNASGTSVKLLISTLCYWLTFRAVGTEVSFGVVFTVTIGAALVAYLPLAFNGVGTVEFAAVTLYGVKDVPADQVLATYLILRSSVFLLAFIGFVISRFLPINSVSRYSGKGF